MAALKISIDLQKRSANRSTIRAMPRQNTCPADFPPFILSQIEQVAQRIVATRKSRGETQAQWAQKLGISQPTMARIERGDPSIATATYVMCLWLVNPQLHLLQLLDAQTADTAPAPPSEPTPVQAATAPQQPSVADEFAELLSTWTAPAL